VLAAPPHGPSNSPPPSPMEDGAVTASGGRRSRGGCPGSDLPPPPSLLRPCRGCSARSSTLFIDFNVATHFLCPVGDPGDDASCFANPLFQLNRHHHHTTTFVAGALDARRRP
jgi:hypothetical protein